MALRGSAFWKAARSFRVRAGSGSLVADDPPLSASHPYFNSRLPNVARNLGDSGPREPDLQLPPLTPSRTLTPPLIRPALHPECVLLTRRTAGLGSRDLRSVAPY